MFHNLVISFLLLFCTSVTWVQAQGIIHTKRYTVSSEEATWIEAFIKCQQNGTELASVESEAEEKRLEGVIKKTSIKGAWLAGIKPDGWLKFVWAVDGKPFIYNNWAKGQPDNWNKVENCLEVVAQGNSKNYKWNDLKCSTKLRFVCQTKQCHWNHWG